MQKKYREENIVIYQFFDSNIVKDPLARLQEEHHSPSTQGEKGGDEVIIR